MTQYHSVWLMPAADDEALLQSVIDELAIRFGAPRFRPHLTVVEDMNRQRGRVGVSDDGGRGRPRRIRGASARDRRQRALLSLVFARFDSDGALRQLKRRAIEKIAPGVLDDFMPHVSLLYGIPDGPDRRAALQTMTRRHVGRRIRFDRLCVVAAASEIPIAEWAVRFSVNLDRSPVSEG